MQLYPLTRTAAFAVDHDHDRIEQTANQPGLLRWRIQRDQPAATSGPRRGARLAPRTRYRSQRDAARIARGGGYSYAAASFGAGSLVIDMQRFDQVLRFETDKRVIEVEAGHDAGRLAEDHGCEGGSFWPSSPATPASRSEAASPPTCTARTRTKRVRSGTASPI